MCTKCNGKNIREFLRLFYVIACTVIDDQQDILWSWIRSVDVAVLQRDECQQFRTKPGLRSTSAYFYSGHRSKGFCTFCMTKVHGSLLPAEVSKGVPPSVALRSWHHAKLEGWVPLASFMGHLDDDRWVGVQKTRIRKMHFFRRKRETIHEHFVVNEKSCHLSVFVY